MVNRDDKIQKVIEILNNPGRRYCRNVAEEIVEALEDMEIAEAISKTKWMSFPDDFKQTFSCKEE